MTDASRAAWPRQCLRSLRRRPASRSRRRISTAARPSILSIAYSVGGGYDHYARMFARHMGKHIPGNPKVVPKNMQGAGGMRLANWLQQRGAEGRHGVRRDQPRHGVRAAARQQGRPIRADQDHLDRQRQRRGQRLHGVAHVRRHDASKTCRSGARGRHRRHRRRHLSIPRASQQHVRRQVQDGHRLCRRQRDQHRDGARRGARPLRHSRGRRSRPRTSTGCATRASIC